METGKWLKVNGEARVFFALFVGVINRFFVQ